MLKKLLFAHLLLPLGDLSLKDKTAVILDFAYCQQISLRAQPTMRSPFLNTFWLSYPLCGIQLQAH